MRKRDYWFWGIIAVIATAMIVSIATAGCNTVEGVRKDIHQITRPAD